ncbi:MAG: hypothetical protein WDW36_001366 [Sanguina aurantia]
MLSQTARLLLHGVPTLCNLSCTTLSSTACHSLAAGRAGGAACMNGSSSGAVIAKLTSGSVRTFASEAKSMLGNGGGFGAAHPNLERVAEAQMSKIKNKMESAGQNADAAPQTIWGKALRLAWQGVKITALGVTAAVGYYTYSYDAKELSKIVSETKTKEGNAFPGSELWVEGMEFYLHIRKNFERSLRDFTDPTYHKLLPDMMPELRGRVKTLVLDLDDLLVHKEWTRKKGWTIYKRPGVQDFLAEMSQYFEIVIFTDEPNSYADPVLNRLDVNHVIPYRLYRPETQYHKGKHVRDLSKLNRDLSQVLFISADPDSWAFQPENAIKLKPWIHDVNDTTLLDLIPFLQLVATPGDP